MNKMERKIVVIIAVMIQLILGVLYGFSTVSLPAWGCFAIWCACSAVIYRAVEVPEII